jgi:octaprenyl-diphosphate synthase
MTLPLIHVLNTCTAKEKSWLINSIKNKDKKRVKEVIAFVKTTTVYSTPRQKMAEFQQEALLYWIFIRNLILKMH